MSSAKRRRPPFAMVPESLLAAVSPRAVVLYALLDRYLGENDRAWPARQTMADRLGCSADTVDRAVAELVDAGYLEVESGKGDGTPNRYLLRDRPRLSTDGGEPGEGCRNDAAPPCRTDAAPGTAPVRHKREPLNEIPPQPPASGGSSDPSPGPARAASHDGSHPNCRACGTSRRGPTPPDPVEDRQSAATRLATRHELVRANPCPDCDGVGFLEPETRNTGVRRCQRCGGEGHVTP